MIWRSASPTAGTWRFVSCQTSFAAYRRSSGGVQGGVKNLIFAANGPKPELVLRDAVSNKVEITRNAQFCLIYGRPIGAEGLTFQALIDWWRDRESIDAAVDDRKVGHRLCARLQPSIGDNRFEDLVFRPISSVTPVAGSTSRR